MKTCIFLIGTNCVGKTTLAKSILKDNGWIGSYEDKITYSKNKKIAFAGKYDDGKFGGVDGLGEVKNLHSIVETALMNCNTIVCEGVKLHSFGLSLQKAIFKAKRQLVVFLYCPSIELSKRLQERSNGKLTKEIMKDQRSTFNSLRKWGSIGVQTLKFDTSKTDIETIKRNIYGILQQPEVEQRDSRLLHADDF